MAEYKTEMITVDKDAFDFLKVIYFGAITDSDQLRCPHFRVRLHRFCPFFGVCRRKMQPKMQPGCNPMQPVQPDATHATFATRWHRKEKIRHRRVMETLIRAGFVIIRILSNVAIPYITTISG